MRTPWRLLADLVSRKPSRQPRTKNQEIKALEYRPVPQEIIPPAAVEVLSMAPESDGAMDERAADNVDAVVSATLEPETSSDVAETEHLSSAADQEEGSALDTIPRDENVEAASIEAEQIDNAGTRVGRPTKARPRSMATADNVSAPSVPSVAEIRSPPSIYDEMLSLDDEIRKLRLDLTRKLTEQNAQMKKMLDRYERR